MTRLHASVEFSDTLAVFAPLEGLERQAIASEPAVIALRPIIVGWGNGGSIRAISWNTDILLVCPLPDVAAGVARHDGGKNARGDKMRR